VTEDYHPEVFIIESLRFEDEDAGRLEGKMLSHMLNLHKKRSKYYYIRTKKELGAVLRLFDESEYRYLHLSCHGDETGMATTLDDVEFDELGRMIRPYLENRRLFVSACEMVNDGLASAIIPKSGCLSVIGPNATIKFSDAAIFWSSLYHLMFSENKHGMKSDALKRNIDDISKLFNININYFAKSKSNKRGYTEKHSIPQFSK
jgi:hypothetical protein